MKITTYKKPTGCRSYKLRPIYGGVRIVDNDVVEFNWNVDDSDKDVISLTRNMSGSYDNSGVQYIYGYMYNQDASYEDKKAFRDYIKHAYKDNNLFSDDIQEFVENAIFRLDHYHRLSKFSAVVTTQSTTADLSILDIMGQYFAEYCPGLEFSFELLKQMYKDVKFNEEAARKAMKEAGIHQVDRQIKRALENFEKLKETDQLFQMKKFLPKPLRSGFYDFLKFETEEQAEIYRNLQGVDVLVYDDFLTSGATVKEIIRYLRSFHDDNRLTVFVLVKQH